MASFQTLPDELQLRCARHLDIRTLKNLRLVSSQASKIGAEVLFQTIVLKFDAASPERFSRVIESKAFRPFVRKVVIDGKQAHLIKKYRRNEDPDEVSEPWSLAIRKIAQIPILKELEYRFERAYPELPLASGIHGLRSFEYRRFYYELLCMAITHSPSLDCLTVKYMRGIPLGYSGAIKKFLVAQSRLKRLAFMVGKYISRCSNDWEESVWDTETDQCFKIELIQHWLAPTQSRLTHLTIYSHHKWGVRPFCDLRQVHFENLVSLALGNWTIAHDWQIDWITSHGETLHELVFDNCSIVWALDTGTYDFSPLWPDMGPEKKVRVKFYDTRWADVFSMLQQHLQHLRHFGFGHPPIDYSFHKRYELPASMGLYHRSYLNYITFQASFGPIRWTNSWDPDVFGSDLWLHS